MLFRTVLGIAGGALAGFAITWFSHCAGGACPLASNYYMMPFLGAMFGLAMALDGGKGAKSG